MSNAGAEAPRPPCASSFCSAIRRTVGERGHVEQTLELRLCRPASSAPDPAATRTEEDAARSASPQAAPLRLEQLARDSAFAYALSKLSSAANSSSSLAGRTAPTDNQVEMLEILGVHLASSGVCHEGADASVPPLRRPAASISSSDVQQPFLEAARHVETWAQTAGESSARDALPPTTSAVALDVEAGEIVMRLQGGSLIGLMDHARALPGREASVREAAWTREWFSANGLVINALLALVSTAQNRASSSSLSSSPVRPPLKLVEISTAAQHGRALLWHLVQPDLVLFAGSEVVGVLKIENREREELAAATRPTLSPLQTSSNDSTGRSTLQETERKLLHQLFVQTATLNVACAAVLGDYGEALMPLELQTQSRSSTAAHISFANEGVLAEYLDRATGLEQSATSGAPQLKWRREHNQILSLVEWALYAAKRHFEEPPPFDWAFKTEELLEVRKLLPPKEPQEARQQPQEVGQQPQAAKEEVAASGSRKRARSSSAGSEPQRGGFSHGTGAAGASLVAPEDETVPWQGPHDAQTCLFLYIMLCPLWQSDLADVYRAWHSSDLSAPSAALPQQYLRTAPPPEATACVIKVRRETKEGDAEPWLCTGTGQVERARREQAAYAALQPLQGVVVPRLLFCGPLELRLQGEVRVLIFEDVGTALNTLTPAAVAAALPAPDVRAAVVAVRAAVVAAFEQLHGHGWRHGDVALRNMLFDMRSGRASIIDLETAEKCSGAAGEMEAVHAELDVWETTM